MPIIVNKSHRKIAYYSLIAALGGLLFGFDIAVFSGTIPFIQPQFSLSPDQLGWVASCLYIGCIAGSVLFGKIAEKLGRKPSFILVAVIFTISSIMMGFAQNISTLVCWRIIAGFSVGGASVLSPLYIAEISPMRIRGKMVSINQLAIVIGVLTAYLSNYFLAETDWNWRWMFISGCGPALLFLLFVGFLPESPRWLIFKGKKELGMNILRKTLSPAEAEEEIEAITQHQLHANQKNSRENPFSRKYIALLVIAITIAIFQQISGANAVLFYAPVIFEKAGMNVHDQLFLQILIGGTNLVFTFIAINRVDKIGRKKLMLIGSAVMSILLLLIGLSFNSSMFSQSMLSVFVLAFIGTYAATLAPVTWVIIAEIFPISIREVSVSMASASLWIACFAITYIFPVMINTLSEFQTFLTFSIICAIYFGFLWFFVPETKHNRT